MVAACRSRFVTPLLLAALLLVGSPALQARTYMNDQLAASAGLPAVNEVEGKAGTCVSSRQQKTAAPGDLDAFMARVLEHRDETWKKLHDYILSETERFELTGPGGVRLHGMRREFSWYVREGYLIRSPIRFDGVAIPEADRRRYEDNWLKEERTRETKRKKDEAKGTGETPADKAAADRASDTSTSTSKDEASLQDLVDQRGEPRFISEAFFLKFKFEAGNYYLAGRERLDGRDIVRIEYYPTRLFGERTESPKEGKNPPRKEDADMEPRIERDLNKVALVTLWIDPAEYQVVRYEFDNVDFGFLPARWLVRLDTVTASMTMARVLDGVWLPRQMSVRAGLTLASGSYGFQYGREFHDYKKAETAAKIRSIRGPDR